MTSQLELVQKNIDLPSGWLVTTLDIVSEIILGQSPPSSTYNQTKDGLPFFQGKGDFGKIHPTTKFWCTSPKKIAEKGDILISVRAPVGPTNISLEKCCIGRGLAVIRPNVEMNPLFIFYQIRAIENIIAKKGTGTTFNAISGFILRSVLLKISPLNEQKRIVTKIEELFSKLDSIFESINYTKSLLLSHRKSILRSAFQGDLTKNWRLSNINNLQVVKDLIEEKKRNSTKRRESYSLDRNTLPKLPDNWNWVTFDDIVDNSKNAIKAGPFGSALKKECYIQNGYKIYGQEQVIRGDPKYGNYYIDSTKYGELESCAIKPHDLLISLVGTIGKTLVLPEDTEPGIINPRLIKISLDRNIVLPTYIQIYFESHIPHQYFSLSSHGGTMSILNMNMIRKLPIPLPSISEQIMIVSELEKIFSHNNNIAKIIEDNLRYGRYMKQSILKQAFEGKLVPQDPNDEPASVLIEKIKQKGMNRK